MDAEQIARLFHETYEELAPQFGYETREASRKPWKDVPEKNKKLMIAVAEKVFEIKKKQAAEDCVEDCAVVDDNKYLREAVSLLNSMILSGEEHTEESRKIVKQVMEGGE